MESWLLVYLDKTSMQFVTSKNILNIKLTFWEKLWSFHGDFKINKKNIVSIKRANPDWYENQIRFPGTFLPGVIKAGSYWKYKYGWEFWYVLKSHKIVYIVTLENNRYKRLVLSARKKLI